MKNISVIGVGKLGLCLCLNLERCGYKVIGVDVSESHIQSLKSKTFNSSEPYVNEFLSQSENIEFSTNLSDALKSDLIFIVVSTPSTLDWKYDHTTIEKIADELIQSGVSPVRKDIVINCTTFPGYCETLHKKLNDYNYFVSYNPEFIAQGSIISDQLNCDNVLIGEADQFAGDLIEGLYKDFVVSNPIFNRMSRTEAELTKISVNCFLTTKISYANMIGDISIRMGCDSEKILEAVGTDSRIGRKYLKPGFGFGGPCFPRDNRALAKCAEEVGIDAIISKATDKMNTVHLDYQVDYFVKNHKDKKQVVDIDYVTFKKSSISIEESQQLKFALRLKDLGYKINVLDNRPEIQKILKGLI